MERGTQAPSPERARAAVAAAGSWFHRFELAPGVETPGVYDPRPLLVKLPLPSDLTGKKVLDIGARDGFFSFEAERRGAQVTAIDFMPPERTGFGAAADLLGSSVDYRVDNVYNLSPERHGSFDLVLCLGVLYHLRNPLLALDRIWAVCAADLVLETQIRQEGSPRSPRRRAPDPLERPPLMEFHPYDSLNDDPTNWWSPNPSCLAAMVESAEFDVREVQVLDTRAIVSASRAEDEHRHYWRTLDGASTVDFDKAR